MNISYEHLTIGTFLAVYGAGIIISFTPCVYPIIPIAVGYLGLKKGTMPQRFFAAFSYVFGLSLVYAALGIIAALSGRFFGELTTKMYVYLGFGIFILALGGSMMDWYQIPLPTRFRVSEKVAKKVSWLAPFMLGVTSGLVASPCTAPVLAGLLLYVATKKAVVTGGFLMFTFALGMNTILLVLGFSANFLNHLPKSSKWMIVIKKILALVIISAGIYFIFKAGQLS